MYFAIAGVIVYVAVAALALCWLRRLRARRRLSQRRRESRASRDAIRSSFTRVQGSFGFVRVGMWWFVVRSIGRSGRRMQVWDRFAMSMGAARRAADLSGMHDPKP